ARLTQKNLALFDKMAKKKTSGTTDGSSTTKTTLTTTSGFAIQAYKNGILEPGYSKPPENLEDIRKRLAKPRATASPPRGYRKALNRPFTGFPKDVGFNNGLSAPQPDFVEGPEMRTHRPFPVDEHVPGAALYRDDPRSITLPQIAGEWKGPTGDMREARMQSAYDGAAMVHARTQALAYMGKEDPPGHAEITTFTTDGTNLNLYAHYATPAEGDENTLEYHQYPISSTNLTGTYQGHKDGRKNLRNAQDHAKTQSEQLRDQLKQHWKQNRNQLPPVAEGVAQPDVEPPPHATDGYEDASPHVL
ncbi:hypothetical protein B0T16DRAFT_289635, partial [Cercophora newfieldiana]